MDYLFCRFYLSNISQMQHLLFLLSFWADGLFFSTFSRSGLFFFLALVGLLYDNPDLVLPGADFAPGFYGLPLSEFLSFSNFYFALLVFLSAGVKPESLSEGLSEF